jgi:hypothetical protein
VSQENVETLRRCFAVVNELGVDAAVESSYSAAYVGSASNGDEGGSCLLLGPLPSVTTNKNGNGTVRFTAAEVPAETEMTLFTVQLFGPFAEALASAAVD